MTVSLDKTIDLRQYARLIGRRSGIILLCAVATLCAALIALAFVPSVYQSEVTLMIEDNRLLSGQLQELMGSDTRPSGSSAADEERMAKLIGRIRSRPFLERVIRTLKMNEDPLVRQRAQEACRRTPGVSVDEMTTRILVASLQSRIDFRRGGPSIYSVIVSDYKAENAQILARWITALFVDTSRQEALDRIGAAHEFGEAQRQIYAKQLRESEATLAGHQESAIARSLRPGAVRESNLALAETLYRQVSEEADLARLRMSPYSEALSQLGTAIDPIALLRDPEIVGLGQSFATTLQNELRQRLAEDATGAPDAQIPGANGALRRSLLQQVEVVAARNYPDASPEAREAATRYVFSKLDLDAQRDAATMLSDAIADYRDQAQSRPGGELERARLEEDVATNRQLLQSFQAQLVASDVSGAVEATKKLGMQIEVLDPAPLPLTPSSPNRAKIIIAALLLGPLLGAGAAFLTDVLDPILRTIDDFSRIVPEPILGTTPLLTRLADHRSWMRRHWVPVALAGVILVTAGFFTVRDHVLQRLATIGVPVQVVDTKGGLDANP
jgi:uncharacterized protein involved in exopolysaccharide biosynthesis